MNGHTNIKFFLTNQLIKRYYTEFSPQILHLLKSCLFLRNRQVHYSVYKSNLIL